MLQPVLASKVITFVNVLIFSNMCLDFRLPIGSGVSDITQISEKLRTQAMAKML